MDKCILEDFKYHARGRIISGFDDDMDYFCGSYKPVCQFHDCTPTTCYCTEFDFKFELSEKEREDSIFTQKGENLMILNFHQYINNNDIDLKEKEISPDKLKESYLYARSETAEEIVERFKEEYEQIMEEWFLDDME